MGRDRKIFRIGETERIRFSDERTRQSFADPEREMRELIFREAGISVESRTHTQKFSVQSPLIPQTQQIEFFPQRFVMFFRIGKGHYSTVTLFARLRG